MAATAQHPAEEEVMSFTATQRALLCLYKEAGRDGVSCYEVGHAAWPDRVLRGGRGVSVNGGGDYAAQMLLGRLKKAGLAEHAPSEGSSRWRLSVKGLREVQQLRDAKTTKTAKTTTAKTQSRPQPSRATVTGTEPCTCGHAPEEHGHDPEYPGSTSCTECDDCITYEAAA